LPSIMQQGMEKSSNSRQNFGRLAILIAVATVDLLGATMVFPQIPFYALHFKASPTFIGVIFASFSLAQLLSAPLWGRISDHYGRRPALLIGLTALGVGYVIFAFANSVWMLLLARIIQGAGGGTTGVTQAYVADTVRPEDRARSLGWLSAGTNVGTMIGPAVGSFLVYKGQGAPAVAAAILCALNLFFAWQWLPESRNPEHVSAVRKPVWRGAWAVLCHPARMASRLTLIYALGMFGQSVLIAVLALYLNSRFGVDEHTIGYFFVYVGIFSVILRSALVGPIVDRLGEPLAIRLGSAALILGFIGYPLAPSLWTLAVVIPLVPIGTAMLFPATTALLSRSTDKADYGLAMGTAQTFAGISRLIAPILSTAMFERISQPSPFFFAAAIIGVGSLLAGRLPSAGPAAQAKEGPVLN
jgi:multidrug resistance protein